VSVASDAVNDASVVDVVGYCWGSSSPCGTPLAVTVSPVM